MAAATTVWQKVGHQTSKRFFVVLAKMESGYPPFAPFRKLLFNSATGKTGQPAEAVYPALNAVNDPAGGGKTTDGGFGLMQLTNPPPVYSRIWHWAKNLDAGIIHIKQKIDTATALFQLMGGSVGLQSANEDPYVWKMMLYNLNNGIGREPYDGAPSETFRGNDVYPVWRWDEEKGWLPRAKRDEIDWDRFHGVRYAYLAEGYEGQMAQSGYDPCGGQ